MCAACRRAALGLLLKQRPSSSSYASSSSTSIFSRTHRIVDGKTDVFRSAAISGTSSTMRTRTHFMFHTNARNEEEHTRDSMKRMSKTRTFHSTSFAAGGVSTKERAEKKRFSAEAATTSTEEDMVETDVQTKKDETKM